MPPPSIPLFTAAAALVATILLPHHARASSTPAIDFARMGTVAVAGSFAGLDIFDPSKNTTFDPSTSTLLLRAQDGSLSPLLQTNQGGSISTACTLDGKLYLAGFFSSVAGVPAQNIASYDPSSATVSPLGGQNAGLNSQVHALYCDPQSHTLWAAGKFTAPISPSPGLLFGPAVARYYPANNSWSPAPFVGLSGASAEVYAITPTVTSAGLLFTGSFLTQFGSNATTLPQNISNPNVPVSSGATPFSSSLVPVPLSSAEVVGSPSSTTVGFSNVKNILCPAGADGPGNSWRAQDDLPSVITVRAFRFITASGVRIGNTFLDGRGAKTFSVAAIPSNNVLTLIYVDPTTKQNVTCSDACPLGYDASVPYQDFLFPAAQVITGFQMTIHSWYGASAGLHTLQLLSSGAFASAIADDNTASCFAPGASAVGLAGQWSTVSANTDIAGTTQDVLSTTVNVGTPSASGPSVTWYPYVSASGQYEVYLMVPGCQNLQDCDSRTSVKITVNPGGGLQPASTTISQQVSVDTNQLIYSGPIYPQAPSYNSTVTLALADNPAGKGVDGKYNLVADRVQFILTSTDTGNSTNTSTVDGTGAPGFGLYEWPLNAADVNATSVLPNTTITTLDKLSSALYSNLGSITSATEFSVRAVAPYGSDSVIFGGQFSFGALGAINVAAYSGGQVIAVSGNGLNGIVTAMVMSLDRQTIYIGGAFTDTADASGGRYRGIVKYDVASSTWTALGGGVDGAVLDVSLANNQVNIAGSFKHVFANPSDSTGTPVNGFATFDLGSSTWINSGGLLVGSMTMSVAGDGNTTAQYIAGSVTSSSQYGAAGWAILHNGSNGQASITSTGARLGDAVGASGAALVRTKKRHNWFTRAASHMLPNTKRQASTVPTGSASPAPAVLAAAFWTNSSTSNEVVVLGGNFSVASSGSGVALYDAGSKMLQKLQGSQVDGVVRTLLVYSNLLFVGGDFSINGVDGRGLGIYQLDSQQWTQPYAALQPSAGSNVVVRSLTTSPAISNTVVVAGTFAMAGAVTCEAICSWDITAKQWRALGDGIRGNVASVDYAGSNLDSIVVGGAFTLADGTPATVAIYSLSNATWHGLGSTPGPVTAIGVNNQNTSSIFAAGRSSNGDMPFLMHWDGSSWTAQPSSWTGATSISQLKLVPLQNNHPSTGVIEDDRMLLISGMIDSSSQGTMSSALYDGQTYYPYLTTSMADGTPGVVSSIFNSYSSFSFNARKFLATGIVILISLAIATGIVFLILLVGIIWTLCSRRETGLANPNPVEDDDDESSYRHRPSSLLEHINAATRTTILGTAAMGGAGAMAHRKGDASQDTHADPDSWVRADTPSEMLGAGAMTGDSEAGDVNRPTHARYSFAGGAEGELPVAAGQEVVVLDDRDQAWWYVRDPVSGREGVVPASYLY